MSPVSSAATRRAPSASRRERRRPSSGSHPVVGRPLRAIVVEDSEDLRAIFSEVLQHSGWDVRACATAVEALAAAQLDPPDVVLTDVNLGSFSGRSLARALRSDPRTARVAVVGVSGSVAPSAALLRDFDAFHAKPVDVMRLGDYLVRALEGAADR